MNLSDEGDTLPAAALVSLREGAHWVDVYQLEHIICVTMNNLDEIEICDFPQEMDDLLDSQEMKDLDDLLESIEDQYYSEIFDTLM